MSSGKNKFTAIHGGDDNTEEQQEEIKQNRLSFADESEAKRKSSKLNMEGAGPENPFTMILQFLKSPKISAILKPFVKIFEYLKAKFEKSDKRKVEAVSVVVFVLIIAAGIILVFTHYYNKPKIFKNAQSQYELGIPKNTSNMLIEKGVSDYNKGYYPNAISVFQEVVESDAPDKDKAVALTYLGMIEDNRGNYTKSIDYYRRALRYDKQSVITYRNLALAYRHANDYESAADAIKQGLDIDPENADNFILLGNMYYEKGNYKGATEEYQNALKINGNNATALYNLGQAMLMTGDEISGVDYLKRAGASDAGGKIAQAAHARLGVIYTQRKDYEYAEKYLNLALADNPNDAVSRFNLGIVYQKQNKNDLALQEFEKAEQSGVKDTALLENLGEAYLNLKQYDKSIKVYNKLLEVNKRNVRVLSRLADINYEKGDLEKAFDLFERITKIEPGTENARWAYMNMGNIRDDAGRPEDAIEIYEKALVINPEDDATYYNMGVAYKNMGKPELAVVSWKKAYERNPDKPEYLITVADYYYENNLINPAMDEFHKILRKWPNMQDGHFKLANIYNKKGLTDYSRKEYERVIEINSKNDIARKAYINLARITAEKKDSKSVDKAERYIQKALMLKKDAEVIFTQGTLSAQKGDHDKAIDFYYQAIAMTRDSSLLAQCYNNIGKSFYKQGLYQKALQAFTRGIDEDSSNEEIRMNRKVAMQAYEKSLER